MLTLPLGYAEGMPWSLANRGEAVQRGRRLPIAGRASMDCVTLFCADGEVALGDEVGIFGAAGQAVEEPAAAAGTLPHELLTRIGARVPRVYREGD